MRGEEEQEGEKGSKAMVLSEDTGLNFDLVTETNLLTTREEAERNAVSVGLDPEKVSRTPTYMLPPVPAVKKTGGGASVNPFAPPKGEEKYQDQDQEEGDYYGSDGEGFMVTAAEDSHEEKKKKKKKKMKKKKSSRGAHFDFNDSYHEVLHLEDDQQRRQSRYYGNSSFSSSHSLFSSGEESAVDEDDDDGASTLVDMGHVVRGKNPADQKYQRFVFLSKSKAMLEKGIDQNAKLSSLNARSMDRDDIAVIRQEIQLSRKQLGAVVEEMGEIQVWFQEMQEQQQEFYKNMIDHCVDFSGNVKEHFARKIKSLGRYSSLVAEELD